MFFQNRHDYLGSEFVFYAILLPVPRALWPSKPDELSFSAEKAFNTRGTAGTTIASTFVGEAYMMGGPTAVLTVGLLFGWLARWWDRFALDLRSNAALVLYASGFFAAALTARSMLFTTTAMLPTLAMWLYVKRQEKQTQRSQFQPVSGTPRLRHRESACTKSAWLSVRQPSLYHATCTLPYSNAVALSAATVSSLAFGRAPGYPCAVLHA